MFRLIVKMERINTQNNLHISLSRYISKKGKMANIKDHRLEGDLYCKVRDTWYGIEKIGWEEKIWDIGEMGRDGKIRV